VILPDIHLHTHLNGSKHTTCMAWSIKYSLKYILNYFSFPTFEMCWLNLRHYCLTIMDVTTSHWLNFELRNDNYALSRFNDEGELKFIYPLAVK